MSRQFWSETIVWATADGTAFSNTATETIIFPNTTLPGNFLQDGRCLEITAFGRYSNVVTAVPTITFALRLGGVAGTMLCQSPAMVTSANAVSAAPWMVKIILTVRSNGSSGTIFAMGESMITPGIAPTMGTVTNYGMSSLMSSTGLLTPAASAAVDLTVDQALSLTGKFSAANASNAMTGHMFVIKALN